MSLKPMHNAHWKMLNAQQRTRVRRMYKLSRTATSVEDARTVTCGFVYFYFTIRSFETQQQLVEY